MFNANNLNLDPEVNPKLSWALRNLHLFPVDVNKASYEMILRVPGIGVKSAMKIVSARKYNKLNWEQLIKIGINYNTSKYFLKGKSFPVSYGDATPEYIRGKILSHSTSKFNIKATNQLSLF